MSDYLIKNNPGTSTNGLESVDDGQNEVATGEISGERTVSGTTPLPESDDNVLESAQEVGLYTEADEENPHEMNIAQEVEEAEIAFRDAPPQ